LNKVYLDGTQEWTLGQHERPKKEPTLEQYKHALEVATDLLVKLEVKLRTLADFIYEVRRSRV